MVLSGRGAYTTIIMLMSIDMQKLTWMRRIGG